MRALNKKKVLILLAHAFATWGFCGAVMGIGMANTTLEKALIIHAIAAPVLAIAVTSITENLLTRPRYRLQLFSFLL